MEHPLTDCTYNKMKLLYKLSCMHWFIEKHGMEDAKRANDTECYELLQRLAAETEKHVAELKKMVCK